jgi:hypothetical protein
VDIPVQFFQSTIALELAIAGALLWEIRYFERERTAERDKPPPTDPRLQLFFAVVIGSTVFGSLWAIAEGGTRLLRRSSRLAWPSRSSRSLCACCHR